MISLIAAMADKRVIGLDNRLPWHIPEDFAWFKKNTLGKTIIMGRKTFESIGRPLPERTNIVVTDDLSRGYSGVVLMSNLEAALKGDPSEERMVIGGASIYEQAMPYASRMYLTFVNGEYEGDTWFPEYNPSDWATTHSEELVRDGITVCRFEILDRL